MTLRWIASWLLVGSTSPRHRPILATRNQTRICCRTARACFRLTASPTRTQTDKRRKSRKQERSNWVLIPPLKRAGQLRWKLARKPHLTLRGVAPQRAHGRQPKTRPERARGHGPRLRELLT